MPDDPTKSTAPAPRQTVLARTLARLDSDRWRPGKLMVGILSSPFVGGFTAAFTVLAGALASFFTNEIKRSYLPFPFADQYSLAASLFWICVFLVGALLGGSQWANNRRSSEDREKSAAATASLESMIRRLHTLPSEKFLPSFQYCLRSAVPGALAAIINPATSRADADAAIRNVLQAIIETVSAFDLPQQPTTYSANVMLFRQGFGEIEAPSPIFPVHMVKDDPKLAGLLELVPSLSATSSSPGADARATAIVLPLPKEPYEVYDDKNSLVKFRVFPGAPWSFIYSEFASFGRIEDFLDWLNTKSTANIEDIQGLRNYFFGPSGQHIRSFCSVPISRRSAPGGTSANIKPIGVLNIDSNMNGLLADNGSTFFAPLLEPFLILLATLITIRQNTK